MNAAFPEFVAPGSVAVPIGGPSPAWLEEVVGALERARPALAARAAVDLARTLGRVGERFLDPRDPFRAEALARLPDSAGLSSEMAVAIVDGMAADWTANRLLRLIEVELGDPSVLDRFVEAGTRSTMAFGPSLCVQVVAGSVPGVGVGALLRSLVLKGPTLLKPGKGDTVLPLLFARGLREVDPALADALAVVYWTGGDDRLEEAAFRSADVVTVYGSDETVAAVRGRLPVTTRLVAYHHRVSIGMVGRDALGTGTLEATAADVVRAASLFDQRGCVSPQWVFVEEGGGTTPAAFAEALASAFASVETRLPTGPLGVAERAALHQARGTAELLAGGGAGGVWHGGRDAWTIVLGPEAGGFAGRVLRLVPVADLDEVPVRVRALGPHLQTVGIAGVSGPRLDAMARELGSLGASRVVPFAAVPFPPAWWHHDGRGPLRDLARWVDLERE